MCWWPNKLTERLLNPCICEERKVAARDLILTMLWIHAVGSERCRWASESCYMLSGVTHRLLLIAASVVELKEWNITLLCAKLLLLSGDE